LLAGLLDDGVDALLAPTALFAEAVVLVSLVCGGVLVEGLEVAGAALG
jgi:hypothetical protein